MQSQTTVDGAELELLEKGGRFQRLTLRGALRLSDKAVERRDRGTILGVPNAGWLERVRVRFDPTDQAEAAAVFRAREHFSLTLSE